MNRISMLLAFALLCSLLPAQTGDGKVHGIFDLSYGMTREQAIAALTAQNFQYGRGQDKIYCMYPAPADTLGGMMAILQFYDPGEKLSSWSIRFPIRDNPELEQNVVQVLTDLHGEGTEIATGTEHRFIIWLPDSSHTIDVSYSEEDGCLWVYYNEAKDPDEEDDEDWDY